jgi:hypothetical protein
MTWAPGFGRLRPGRLRRVSRQGDGLTWGSGSSHRHLLLTNQSTLISLKVLGRSRSWAGRASAMPRPSPSGGSRPPVEWRSAGPRHQQPLRNSPQACVKFPTSVSPIALSVCIHQDESFGCLRRSIIVPTVAWRYMTCSRTVSAVWNSDCRSKRPIAASTSGRLHGDSSTRHARVVHLTYVRAAIA